MNDLLPVEAPGISPAAAPASARSGLRADAVDGLSFAAVVEAEADRARGEDKQENPDGLPELAAAQAMWMTLPLPAVSEAAPEAAPEAETGTPEAGPAAIAAEEAAPRLARGDWGYTVRLLDRVVSAAADGRAPAALAHRPSLWEEAAPVGAPVTTAGTSSGISTGISSGISTGTPAEAADEAALSAAPDIEAALADLLGPVAGDGWDGVLPPGPQAQWFRPVRAGRTADAAGDVRVTAGEAALSGAAAAEEILSNAGAAGETGLNAGLNDGPDAGTAQETAPDDGAASPAPIRVPPDWVTAPASEAPPPSGRAPTAGPAEQAPASQAPRGVEASRAAEPPTAAAIPFTPAAPGAETPVALPAGAGPEDAARTVRQLVASAALREGAAPEIRLRLHPEFLGRVQIVLTATAEGMAIRIRAENEAVRGLLAAHAAEWQAEMRDQGIPMRSLDITGGALAWDMTGGDARRTGADARRERRREDNGRTADGAVPLARFHAAHTAPVYEIPPPASGGIGGVDLRA